ncbi:MAG TPA: transporter substrate-binding domain-containing protein [Rheinheimera sp.]|nr:transporter substrate-binding domain-containing protein [Rheinheimera sp.]
MRQVIRLIQLLCGILCFSVLALPTLRVVTELSPPHQTINDGVVSGLSTELVLAILQKANITASISMYPWARSFHIAKTQPNVLIYNMARTPEREQEFHWIGTVAAYQLGFVSLSHRSDITISQLDDAKRYTTAVQRDDVTTNYLLGQDFSNGDELVITADIMESWHLLLNGKVDLVVDDPVALHDMAQRLGVEVKQLHFVYAIPELAQNTWLAASIGTPMEVVKRLQQAHSEVAKTERYQQVMSSGYRNDK